MILSSMPAASFTRTTITPSSLADPISVIFECAEYVPLQPSSSTQRSEHHKSSNDYTEPHFHFKIQFVFLVHSLTQAYSIKSPFSFIFLSSFHFFQYFYASFHHFWYKKLLNILQFGTPF